MVYKRVRVWTSGRSLPVLKFVKYPPPPGGADAGSSSFEVRHFRLVNPPSGNVKIQKLIAKHMFECFEKRKGEDGKATLGLN